LRKPFSRYNIHIRGSYATEASSIIELFAKKKGHKKIAIFYQNDAFGEAVKSVTETAMNDHGLKPVALGSFERNTLEIETGLKNIVDAKPESIVMVGTYAPLAKFVKSAKAAGLKDSLFYTVSFVGPEVLSKELGDQGSNVFITQVIPPYQESSLPLVTKYKEDLAKYFTGEAPSFPGLEAYANACVLVEGLQNAGKDLTRENLIDSILAIDSGIASLGLNVSYGAEDNQGLENVFITSLQGEKWVEVK